MPLDAQGAGRYASCMRGSLRQMADERSVVSRSSPARETAPMPLPSACRWPVALRPRGGQRRAALTRALLRLSVPALDPGPALGAAALAPAAAPARRATVPRAPAPALLASGLCHAMRAGVRAGARPLP